jgi:hypothetical protein
MRIGPSEMKVLSVHLFGMTEEIHGWCPSICTRHSATPLFPLSYYFSVVWI